MKDKIAAILDGHDLRKLLDLFIDSRRDSFDELCVVLCDIFPDLKTLYHFGSYQEFYERIGFYLKKKYSIDIGCISYNAIRRKTEEA